MLEERLGANAAEPPRTPAPTGRGQASPTPLAVDDFVGRREELDRLRGAVQAAREGIGSLFLVSGEPGIGKTRLAFEVTREARERDVRVVWGRCWEAGGAPPYWPWIEVLRPVLAGAQSSLHLALGRHAAQLARLVPEALPGTEPAAAPADPESGRFLLFDAVQAALRLAATERPLLLVVDDLHAADRASALLLAFLSRTLKDCGIVLVGTYRDAEAHSTPELVEALGELSRGATRLALGGLDSAETRSILEAARGVPPADALLERIHRITDGNPFFVREIARLLSRAPANDTDGTAFPVPEGIRETVRRRLQPLAAPVRSLLAIAAVAGREFDGVVVSRAAHLEAIEFLDLLEPAMAHAIVDPVPGDRGRFSFRHALIQETIYDDLAAGVRIQLHADFRDALEHLAPTAPDRYVAELAHHALAAAPADEDECFVEHGVRAARVAMQRMAFEEAVRIYEHTIGALVHARPNERRRCELLVALGEAKEWANDARGSRAVIEQAAEIARRTGARDLLARAALAVGGIEALKATASSRCETAANLIVEALEQADPDDQALRARLRSRLSLHYLTSGESGRALAESDAAVRNARASADRDTVGHALIARHAVIFGPDHLDERCAIVKELLELAGETQNREFAMRAQALRVVNALELGDMVVVDEATTQHGRLAEETQDPFERWANVMWRCARALLVGRFEEASAFAEQGLSLTKTVPGPHAFEINGPSAYLGQLLLIADTRFGALQEPAQVDARRARFQEVLAWHVANLLALTRLRRTEEIRAQVDDLMARGLADLDRSGTWLGAMSVLAEAVAVLADDGCAEQLYPKLLPYAHHNIAVSFVACRGSASRFLGLLAMTMGRRDDAVRHFEDALAMNRRMGALPHVAATLHDFASALVAEARSPRDAADAVVFCREALKIASELRMEGLVVRCNELLAAYATANAAARPDFELVSRGAFWSLSHAGSEVLVKDRKGLHYIAELLRNPDRDVHVRTLVAVLGPADSPAADPRATKSRVARESGAHSRHFSEQLVDPRARRAYQRRIAELDDDLRMAGRLGDPEQLAVLREERAALERELARITGLGGRLRQANDGERMRIAVTRAIRSALVTVAEASPAIGGALARRIRTGNCCRYSAGLGAS